MAESQWAVLATENSKQMDVAMQTYEQQRQEMETEKTLTRSHIDQLEDQIDTLNEQIKQQQEENKQITSAYNQEAQAKNQLQVRLEETQKTGTKLENQLQEIATVRDQARKDRDHQIGLNQQLSKDLGGCRTSAQKLQEDLTKASAINSTQQDQLKKLEKESSENLKLKTSLAALESRVDDRNITIGKLEKQNEGLQADARKSVTLQADLDTSKSRIQELTSESGELKTENKQLHKQVGTLEGQLKQ